MCQRIGLVTDIADVKARLNAHGSLTGSVVARADAEPGEAVPVLRYDALAGLLRMETMRWGLIPRSATKAIVVRSIVDVRACGFPAQELNDALCLSQRCLVPVDYFDEWHAKRHFRIRQADRQLMTLAGVWEDWRSPGGGVVRCFAILTTVPNAVLESIRDRMPIIVSSRARDLWFKCAILEANVKTELFRPPPNDEVSVSRSGA